MVTCVTIGYMVTKYNIPCSCCGKIVERYIFCSGACKVKGSRERKSNKEITKNLEPDTKSNILPDVPPTISSNSPQFSDVELPGYKFSSMIGKYVKQ